MTHPQHSPVVTPADIRADRTSIKWTRFDPDVLPLFVAEMDFPVAESVRRAIIERIEASDLGYLDAPGPLTPAFSAFARDRWGWEIDPAHLTIATDVSVGIVETLRYGTPAGGSVVITPPVYPPFFELVEEKPAAVVQVPLLVDADLAWSLDLDGLAAAFADADAFLLCNPHNPVGLVHDEATLREVARLAAQHDVLVVSDEVHAPLVHPGVDFTPFAPLAAAAGARAVTVTSASKAWNIAGAKCAVVVASDDRAAEILRRFPEEVECRASIIGLHANVAAFGDTGWLDATVDRIVANDALLAELLADRLPAVVYHRPRAGYLGWLDFRGLGLGDDPAVRIREEARVAFNSGPAFGVEGRGFARINLACAPETLREAVARIASTFGAGRGADD